MIGVGAVGDAALAKKQHHKNTAKLKRWIRTSSRGLTTAQKMKAPGDLGPASLCLAGQRSLKWYVFIPGFERYRNGRPCPGRIYREYPDLAVEAFFDWVEEPGSTMVVGSRTPMRRSYRWVGGVWERVQ